ncbi:MAG: hypothetical protein IPM02_11985 [Betaproteobacteria bacterium]|nr:hypothetical protein [Betaproteobacteria bacterium]
MDIKISFSRGEPRDRMVDPIEYHVNVDGAPLLARIELSALQALNEGGPGDAGAIRDFAFRNRDRIERAIEAHILARGVPPGHLIVPGWRNCGRVHLAFPGASRTVVAGTGGAVSGRAL